MIPEQDPILPGMTVRHDPEGGLLYRVEGVALDTDGYEESHALNGLRRVSYTQLEAGGYPPGSPWNKSEAEFRANFTVIDTESTAQEVGTSVKLQRTAFAKALAGILGRGYTLTTADIKYMLPYYGYSRATSLTDIFLGSRFTKAVRERGVTVSRYTYGTNIVYLDGDLPEEETDLLKTIASLKRR